MDDDARSMIAIAKAGSISEAARQVHISQPALSQRLKQLEQRLGTMLFDRSESPLKPTHSGTVYLEWARGALEAENRMTRELADIANLTTRRLQVGLSLPRGNGMLPPVIDRFYRETRGCTLFLYEAGMPETHNQLLASGEIDCAVLTPVRPETSLFAGTPICDEQMLLVAPKDWDIPVKAEADDAVATGCGNGTANGTGDDADAAHNAYPVVAASAIAGLPFIMPPSRLKHNRIVRAMMDRADVRLDVVFHSCSSEMTMEMIERGLGVSIAPNTFAYGRDTDRISRYAIEGFETRSHLYYNRRIGEKPTEDENAFIRILREEVVSLDAMR